MEEETENEYKEVMKEINKIRNSNIGVNSTTEALLLMINSKLNEISADVDTIRFNNC